MECVANKHKWICSDPLIFGNEKKQWAGYTDFYVPVSENVKSGMYELNYIDAQENVVSRIINLNYDTDFLKMTGNQAALAEKKDFREEIAVYSESGTLLFYGMRKNNWRNDSSIFSLVIFFVSFAIVSPSWACTGTAARMAATGINDFFINSSF